MAMFVHIAADKDAAKIRRSGIRIARTNRRKINGVFLSAVTKDYMRTHQWHREVQRIRNVPKVAVRIRIPDSEDVYIGKYSEEHLKVTAAHAVAISRRHDDPMGLEVILPRPVSASEILRIYVLPKAVGWRFYPGAKRKKPCGCPYCQRGEPSSRKLSEAYEDSI